MKLLFIAIPGTGLYLSTLPLAWAARAAGHEVLILNNGEATTAIANAGLLAVDACPERDLWAEFIGRAKGRFASTVAAAAANTPPSPAQMAAFWGFFGEHMAEGALRIARSFKPHAVVATMEQGAGRIVADALGCPWLEQSVRLGWGGDDERVRLGREGLAEYLLPTRQRLGVMTAAKPPLAALDIRPPRLGGRAGDGVWLVQSVPFNGGKALPSWVVQRPNVPRLVLTLGSVVPMMGGLTGLQELIGKLATLDIELVLALGDLDLTSLGEMPKNARVAGWMPLNALMPTTAVIIHHGGAATCFTPFYYGVPQLALPKGADQPYNAKVVAESGAGLMLRPEESQPEAVLAATLRLLREPAFREAARAVQLDIAAQPTPAQIIERLERHLRT